MIAAFLGRFFLHCIKRAQNKAWRAETRRLDFDRWTEQQVKDFLEGRPVPLSPMDVMGRLPR